MRVKSFAVFVRILVFGLVLGASSTAYADAIAITSFTVSNIQFTPATGTAIFMPTSSSVQTNASNSLGEAKENAFNTFPLATSFSAVTFASAAGTGNAENHSVSGTTIANVAGCTCSAASFAISSFSGNLVIVGGTGEVDVTVSGLISQMRQVQTDQFGVLAESEVVFDILVNGVAVFSVDSLLSVSGPNQFALVEGSNPLSRLIKLQFGAVNTVEVRLTTRSLAVNEVPEPATVLLLVSGLGFMTGVLKKRRAKVDR